MRKAFQVVAHLISLGVVLQTAFVAAAWFAVLKNADDNKVFRGEDDFNAGHVLHSVVGMGVIPLLGIALLVVGLLSKVPGAARWGGLTLLAIVVQVLLALVASGVPVLGALHGIGAFAVLGLAEVAARQVASTTTAESSGATA